MFKRIAKMASLIGSNNVQKRSSNDIMYDEDDDACDEDEDEQMEDSSEALALCTPIYHVDFAVESMTCFPRFYLARSANGKFLIGVMAALVKS
jgi:hypothetical protein